MVELSIVLVILGLLVGGVLGGKSLIRASQLRSITTQHSAIYSATLAFRDKYFALPGDMTNAGAVWGLADPVAAICRNTFTNDARTCNGDGNGKIEYITAGSSEISRYWQQLANAGLIEGRYCGASLDYCTADPPASLLGKITGTYWWVVDAGSKSADYYFFNGDYNNIVLLSSQRLLATVDGLPGTFLAEDMWNIDTKMDDGKPASGKIMATAKNGLETCTTATGTTAAKAATVTASYLLTADTPTCSIIFRQQF